MTYTYKLSRRLATSHEPARTLRPLVLLLLALLATACGTGELTDPFKPKTPDSDRATPGWLSLTLTTPRGDDGAVRMTVMGPAMDSLQVAAGRGFASLSGGTGRVLVLDRVESGVVARFWVPDTRNASIYVATVDEAAARGTYRLQDLTQGYGARVTR